MRKDLKVWGCLSHRNVPSILLSRDMLKSPEADEASVGVHSTVGVVNRGKGGIMCKYWSSCYSCCFAGIEGTRTIISIMNRSDR